MPMSPCPACGAPLEYTGDGETVQCHFCGAEFQVTEVDGRPHFEVSAQPGPQKEVLQNQVAQIAGDPNETPDQTEPSAGQARVYPTEPDAYQQAYQADLNPPGASPAFSAHTGETSRWSGVEPVPTPSTPQPMQAGGANAVRRSGTPGRWIAIGVAAIILICLACFAVAALFFIYQTPRGGF